MKPVKGPLRALLSSRKLRSSRRPRGTISPSRSKIQTPRRNARWLLDALTPAILIHSSPEIRRRPTLIAMGGEVVLD
jgi:hypothetical protein